MISSLRAQEGLLVGLIDTVLKEIPEQLQQIAEAIAPADSETAAIAAYSLKGTVAIFGARRMQKSAAEVEQAVDAGTMPTARLELERLQTEGNRVPQN
jgi:HPt (histidine-containing phosphotransfer) domain-containing protein